MPVITKGRSLITNVLSSRTRIRRPRRTTLVVGALLLVIIGFAIWRAFGDQPASAVTNTPRQVSIARVSDLALNTAFIPTVGNVESVHEAVIRAEAGGQITRVRSALGDFVNAGSILAEIENSSQRAATLQAEGAYDAARAALAKTKNGTRNEQLSNKEAALESARGGVITALLSAYGTLDSAVNDTADQMFTDIELGKPTFTPPTSNQQVELDIEHHRSALIPALTREARAAKSVSASDDLKSELATTEGELRDVRSFMDSILLALSNAIVTETYSESDIAALKASATASRTALTMAIAGIVNARAGLETAQNNLQEGVSGAVSEDIAASEANVKQAQGAYNAALANLEKTLIRSPIAGTLNNFSIKLGDFVQPSQQVAVVSNNGALEIIAYVTDSDKSSIAVGNTVRVEDEISGTVTKIAPALDPVSRRIEVRIGLPKEASTKLTNGQSARLDIARTKQPTTNASGPILIPITALKLEPDRNVVFTVKADNALEAHLVTISTISSSFIRVTNGLTPEMEIVVDARGLKEGDTVTVGNTQ